MGPDLEEFTTSTENIEMQKTKEFDRIWRMKRGGSIDCLPVIFKEKIFIASIDNNIYCLDMKGNERCRFQTEGMMFGIPAVKDNLYFMGSTDGKVYAIDMEKEKIIWKFQTGG